MTAVHTLDKIKRLERYIAVQETADSVFDLALDKLLDREMNRWEQMQDQLHADLIGFEQVYGIDSDTFYRQYEEGKLGDAVDFVEWSSTVEMMKNAQKHLGLLRNNDHL